MSFTENPTVSTLTILFVKRVNKRGATKNVDYLFCNIRLHLVPWLYIAVY